MKRSKLFPGTKISRNPGLIIAEYWKKDPDGWTLAWTRSGGSVAWVKLLAADTLKHVVTTRYNYHRDMGRADYIRYIPADGSDEAKFIEPEVIIVPSVGELGYW